jgi:hypothetical protein
MSVPPTAVFPEIVGGLWSVNAPVTHAGPGSACAAETNGVIAHAATAQAQTIPLEANLRTCTSFVVYVDNGTETMRACLCQVRADSVKESGACD